VSPTGGVDCAAIALSRSLNANLLRRWVVEAERAAKPPQGSPQLKALPPPFILVAIGKSTHADPRIRIEIRRGATVVSVDWPPYAARNCAEWLSGLLK
jgi:hypothetical protein